MASAEYARMSATIRQTKSHPLSQYGKQIPTWSNQRCFTNINPENKIIRKTINK